MAKSKEYKVLSKAPFTGSRAIAGYKGIKNQDVRFFDGVSESVSEQVAKACAKEYGYKAVKESEAEDAAPALDEQVPGREELIAAGITRDKDAAAMSKQELVELDGIGDATADKIIAFYEG